ncbi:MAG: hypothetical protein RLZZ347_284 [Candidatus Parcubacteria bacterium]|jgi:hypothetical protein
MNNSRIQTIILFCTLSLALPFTTFAHRNPVGCSGSGLGISLYTDNPQVHVGDSIIYSVDVFNGTGVGPVVCDATDIVATLVTPDGVPHPITLLRTALANTQLDTYANITTYIVRAIDIKPDGTLTATAVDTGTIHQNNTDSVGGGFQGLNLTIIATPPPPPSIPTPSGGGGGFVPPPVITLTKIPTPDSLPTGPGSVTYTYVVKNGGTSALNGVWVKDDKCTPVTFVSGDSNSDKILDTTETWIYTCTKLVSQTETNIATTHGSANGWDAYATAVATVPVATTTIVTAVPTATIAFVPPDFIPQFPNTGLPPQELEKNYCDARVSAE